MLEVGLGGRLDATNVLQPAATAITSIAFDHERYLGSTLDEIAFEKAGIIKPGVPVVVGDLACRDAPSTVIAIASRAERGAEVVRTAPHRRAQRRSRSACAGAHQTVECGRRGQAARVAGPRRGSPFRARRSRTASRDPTGRDASSVAVCPAAARCCSTPRTTRPARPRSRPTSQRRPEVRARWSLPPCATRTRRACSRALLPAVSHLILTRASNRAIGRAVRPGSAGARDPRSAGDHRAVSQLEHWRPPGASRRASSSPDRFSCSAT